MVTVLTATIIKAYLTKNAVEAVALPALILGISDSLQKLIGGSPQSSVSSQDED